MVWEDQNRNGIWEGEPGIAGVTVILRTLSGAFLRDTTTAWDGFFEFTSIEPGSYLVEETDLPGYASSTFNIQGAIVPAGGEQWIEFGDYKLLALFLPIIVKP